MYLQFLSCSFTRLLFIFKGRGIFTLYFTCIMFCLTDGPDLSAKTNFHQTKPRQFKTDWLERDVSTIKISYLEKNTDMKIQ